MLTTKTPLSPVTSLCVIIHICVCVFCAQVCGLFLCGVITGCPALGGVHVYPACSLSCHCGSRASAIATATNRRAELRLGVTFKTQPVQHITHLSGDSWMEAEPKCWLLKVELNYLSASNGFFSGGKEKKLEDLKYMVNAAVFRITLISWTFTTCFQCSLFFLYTASDDLD